MPIIHMSVHIGHLRLLNETGAVPALEAEVALNAVTARTFEARSDGEGLRDLRHSSPMPLRRG